MSHEANQAAQELDLVPREAALAASQTRRTLLGRAAAGVAVAGGAGALLGHAEAAAASASPQHVLRFIVTQEGFGVTFLTEAVRRAPGTPSEQFVGVLKAANTTEFDHYRALRRIGARPQTLRYWIPDAAFGGGGAGLFESIEKVETIEISLYLVGVTAFTRIRHAFRSRLCAEALGTEAEHRVLARFAQGALGVPIGAPNNVGFERYHQRSAAAAKNALQALGIGYGKKGAEPGKFYEYPGNPLANGTGAPVSSRAPR